MRGKLYGGPADGFEVDVPGEVVDVPFPRPEPVLFMGEYTEIRPWPVIDVHRYQWNHEHGRFDWVRHYVL
jgi:hypothetical protein